MQYGAAWTIGSSYDASGNLTSDGSTSFTYDMENRLVAASGAKGANLRYDPLGRLYEVNGPFGLTRFIYDGDHVAAEYNSAGTVLRRYMWGPGADEPILWDEGSAVNCSGGKFLHPDRQGSVVAAADCAGALIGINKYDEYGIPQSGNTGRFQYTGQAWLPELGMYYYKARIYSPTLGRFLQTDPIGYKDQFNLYAYVGNDPVNKSDPKGLEGEKHPSASPDDRRDVITLGVGGSAVVVAGVTFEIGVYVNTKTGDYGVYETRGVVSPGKNLSVGAGISVGVAKDNASLAGQGTQRTAGLGPASVSQGKDSQGKANSESASVGKGVGPVTLLEARTTTVVRSLGNPPLSPKSSETFSDKVEKFFKLRW